MRKTAQLNSHTSTPRLVACARRAIVTALLALATAVHAELPTVCAPCDTGGSMVSWKGAGSASQYVVDGAEAFVRQALERETFNWASFNIGPDNKVTFQQPNSTSVALNRIFQSDPTRIFGALQANGQVILINQNGILFKPGSSVDVNTLVASSLEISDAARDSLDIAGVVATDLAPAFKNASGGAAAGVRVEAGASIRARENGRVILIGGTVENSGRIEVSGRGGQALLAAENDEVYLYLEDDPDVRGLAVALTEGGEVTNGGTVLADRGNITLAGLTVNQNGLARATTAVDANGSIRLLARDRSRPPAIAGGTGELQLPEPVRGGTVTFGGGSRTEVLPLADDTAAAIDGQPVFASRIEADAKDITLRSGASITAPAGTVEMSASSVDDIAVSAEGTIRIERGASIDVSGLDEVTVSVARNFLEQEIRRNELADSPVQRDGPLFGETVTFDIRKPLPDIVNVDAAVANVERTVAERSTVGGSIALTAAEAVVVEPDAVLDVSGGVLTYAGAFVGATKLIVEGRVVDVSEASPFITYDAVLSNNDFEHEKWGAATTESFWSFGPAQLVALTGFQPGYLEGKDAGSIAVTAPEFDVRGELYARTVHGDLQRKAPGASSGFTRAFDEIAAGGQLRLISTTLGQSLVYDGDGFSFGAEGFDDYDLALADFELVAGAALALRPQGSLSIRAADAIVIDGTIAGPGATVALIVNPPHSDAEKLQDDVGAIALGAAATIDLEGAWVLDDVARTQTADNDPIFIDGGSFSANVVGDLSLAAGSFVDVGGGAYVNASGEIEAGRGGEVSLTATTFLLSPATVDTLTSSAVEIAARFEGFTFAGAANGSRFALNVPQVLVDGSDRVPAPGTVTVAPALFSEFGFHDFELASNERAVVVAPGLDLDIKALDLMLPDTGGLAGTSELPVSGTDIDDFAVTELLDDPLRMPTSFAVESRQVFSTISGAIAPNEALTIPATTRIAVDTGGALSLSNDGSIIVSGALTARGGQVSLATTPVANFGYLPDFGVWLARGSLIDVSGAVVPTGGDALGRTNAVDLVAGGTVDINARSGYVIGMPGSRVDVSGGIGDLTITAATPGSGLPQAAIVRVGSDAGEIRLTSAAGIQFFSDLKGGAASELGATGATLALTMDGNLRQTNQGVVDPNVDFPAVITETFEAVIDGSTETFGIEQIRVLLGETAFPAGITTGEAVPDAIFDIGTFSLSAFAAGGFADLDLAASPNLVQKDPVSLSDASSPDPVMQGVVELVGNGTIAIPRQLSIEAPVIQSDGGNITINTRYLRLGFANEDFVTSDTPVVGIGAGIDPETKYFSAAPGIGAATFQADFIDFEGFTALRGFGGSANAVRFSSRGDIRFRGVRAPNDLSLDVAGALIAESDVLLRGDRIYGSTLTNFLILNELEGGRVTFAGNAGSNQAIPLSAGSRLTVESDSIHQLGNVFAPIGSITLDADSELILGADSLTSVTASGLSILFGRTEVGDWAFPFPEGGTTRVFDAVDTEFELPPDKRISLIADGVEDVGGTPTPIGVVEINPGAILDVRSGGDLIATEFLPGPLGKVDLLDASRGNGSFALLPNERGVGPVDPLETPVFEFGATAQIVITDGGDSGLPAGSYAVLPPRYALLPGAVLLTPAPDTGSAPGVTVNPTKSAAGIPLAAGRIGEFGDGAAVNEVSLFTVETGAAVRQRAEYAETSADAFFSANARDLGVQPPLLPRDAGAVSIATNASLSLGGTIAPERDPAGIGSRVDISARNIVVGTPGESMVADGTILLDAAGLEQLNADSILIGGTRAGSGGSSVIDVVTAESVSVDTGTDITLPELILVGTDAVTVDAGAAVSASGSKSGGASSLTVEGDGALLLVSAGELPRYNRNDTGATSGATLTVEDGATLFGAGALILDSSDETIIDGADITAGRGAGVHFGAARILIGDVPGALSGLRLSPTVLNQLIVDESGAVIVDELELVSRSTVDFFGDVDLVVSRLLIDAAGIGGGAGVGTVTIASDELQLRNTAGTLFTTPAGGTGDLMLTASGSVRLGHTAALDPAVIEDGDFDIRGFANVGLRAADVIGIAEHAIEVDAGTLEVDTGRVTTQNAAALSFAATGDLEINRLPVAAEPETPSKRGHLGGRIKVVADSVTLGSTLFAPSGVVELTAGSGDVLLGPTAHIDTSGLEATAFGPVGVNTPGGIVRIEAAGGNVAFAPNAVIDVAAGSGDIVVDGGMLDVSASGTLQIAATTRLHGVGEGATARLDVNGFADGTTFSGLNTLLNDGGFSGERSLRIRGAGEDLTVAVDDTVRAHEIRLAVDDGDLNLLGSLSATGERGGLIELIAGGDLVVGASAQLSAVSTGGFLAPYGSSEVPVYDDGFAGGRIHLTSTGGQLVFETSGTDQAALSVAGTKATDTGTLVADPSGFIRLTAPRTAGNGVDLGTRVDGAGPVMNGVIEAAITGARQLDLVGHERYGVGDVAAIIGDAGVTQALSGSGVTGLATRVVPGVEVFSAGAMNVSALGLSFTSLFNAASITPGVLTFRSAADVTIAADIQDGLTTDLFGGLIADADDSWTLRFVAGADLAAADALAVVDGTGALAVGTNVDIWTGTGDIVLRSGGNMSFAAGASLASTGRHMDPVDFRGEFTGSFFLWTTGTSYPEIGGDIDIRAGGDIDMVSSNQTIRDFTYYYGLISESSFSQAPRAWAYSLSLLDQNVVSLAGGDIALEAGGAINGGQISMTTSGRQDGAATLGFIGEFVEVINDDVTELGGGTIDVFARGDVSDIDFAVMRGNATVRSFGAIGAADAPSTDPRLFIGDAAFDLQAARGVELGLVVDPTITRAGLSNPNPLVGFFETEYFSMTPNSALNVVASSGDVRFNNPAVADAGVFTTFNTLLNMYPDDVDVLAASGSLLVAGPMSFFPSSHGTFTLLAQNGIGPARNSVLEIAQIEADPGALETSDLTTSAASASAVLGTDVPGLTPLHGGDIKPNVVVADAGDIRNLRFTSGKSFVLEAGRDVSRVSVFGKHVNAGDSSIVVAGRDIVQPTVRNALSGALLSSGSTFYTLEGPGEFSFLAGRDINMGTSSGIVTVGAALDSRLAERGGSVNLFAGMTESPDLMDFIATYADGGGEYETALRQYLTEQRAAGRGVDAALAPVDQFAQLEHKDQLPFVADIFFAELEASGVAASDPESLSFQDYSRGFTAIATLFAGTEYTGNVRTPLSTVQTQEGGSIRLLAPGGIVDAGLTATEGLGAGFKGDDELGFIAFREGDIKAFVHDDFNVNSTRVFAQQGGDILIWSSTGDIDAGRGAKTATSLGIPSPEYDPFGNFLDKPPLQVVGSGIRNFAPAGVAPGTLFLFAPQGVINAGDAGIGSAGNIVIGATEVIGAENIDVGGVAIGVPAGDTGGLAAGLVSVGDVAASATKATEKQTDQRAAQQAAQAAEAFDTASLSIIQVEVLGFGT